MPHLIFYNGLPVKCQCTLVTVLWVLSFFSITTLNAQYEFKAGAELIGLVAQDENPFWSRANTLGQISRNTDGLAALDAFYTNYLGDTTDIEIGVAAFVDYGTNIETKARLQSYYVNLNTGIFSFSVGAKPRDTLLSGLSTTNGDILFSNNAGPLPGVEANMCAPLRLSRRLGVQAGMANYWLNDERVVDGAMVHFKYMMLHWKLSRTATLKTGLHHYAQWGGTSERRGIQPSSFSDFTIVFIGGGGQENAFSSDQGNALGNHIGSWRAHYTNAFRAGDLEVYFQNLFEDSSGILLGNFPDGLWGVHWKLAEPKIFESFLFEFVQTTWQSGLKPGRGFDNYFNNSTYASGWTYFGRTVGTPLIIPFQDGRGIESNAVKAFHFGAKGKLDKLTGRFLMSYVLNRGTRFEPIFEESFFMQAAFQYAIHPNWRLQLQLAGDLNFDTDSQFGGVLSLRYQFTDSFRR